MVLVQQVLASLTEEMIVAATEKLLHPFVALWKAYCHLSLFLWGEGDWKLRPLHQMVIDHLLSLLNPDLSETVRLQLQQRYFVQFIPDGRVNSIYFNNLPRHLVISDSDFSNALYKIEMYVDGIKQQVIITFSTGQIFTIEFRKDSNFYKGKKIRFGAITRGSPNQSYAGVIDRLEHGTAE